jgi:flagellar basal-body rod modification protein FlgD
MTTTAPLTSTTTNAAATSTINSGLAGIANNYQTFLSLLTTQLQNQDPLSPMDTTQFTSQLTQMTGVEQQLLSNQLLQQLVNQGGANNSLSSAVNLIGHTVTVDGDTATLTGGKATWSFSLPSAPSSMTVSVVDSNNNVVWTGPVTASGAGAQSFTWNGQTLMGEQAKDGGTYSLAIKAIDANGQPITPVTSFQGAATAVEQVGGQTMVTVNGARTPIASIIGVGA